MVTKADMRRAIIRTAALAHWRHNFTACSHPANDDTSPAPCGARTDDFRNGSVGHSVGI